MKKITYNSESQLRSPLNLFKQMMKDLMISGELTKRLFWRNISANYKTSLLGYFWAFIPSIVVAYGLLAANNSNVINIQSTDLPYPAYVMLSMVLWQTFVDAVNGPLQAVQESKMMLAKINFPRESIIFAKVGEVVFNFLIKMILVIGIFLFYQIALTPSLWLAPIGILSLILLGTTIGLFLAPIGAILQDVSRGLGVFVAAWLFITPVLYPVPTAGLFSKIVKFNPVTPLLITTREMATGSALSDINGFVITSIASVICFLCALILYRVSIPYIVERLP